MLDLRFDRKRARRAVWGRLVVLSIVALTLLMGPLAQNAGASKAWCRTDPVVVIDGYVADIFVSGPLDAPMLVTGPTEIVVTVPRGVDAWLLVADPGFGRGVNVRFDESASLRSTSEGVEVKVEVLVPASEEMPILVEVAPRVVGLLRPAAAEGTANRWLSLKTSV